MGNHDAGRAMVKCAEALFDQMEKTGQTALEILDIACKGYEGCDAEFDDSADPDQKFGKLITMAFAPEYDKSTDLNGEGWFFNAYDPFSQRYGLC